jgi:hypothetical protein
LFHRVRCSIEHTDLDKRRSDGHFGPDNCGVIYRGLAVLVVGIVRIQFDLPDFRHKNPVNDILKIAMDLN